MDDNSDGTPLVDKDEYASLQAEPKMIDFEVIPIYESQSRDFDITNRGPEIIEANLIICHEQWLRDFPPELINVIPNYVKLEPNRTSTATITVRPSKATMQNFYVVYELVKEGKISEPVIDGGGDYGIEVHGVDIQNKHLLNISFIGDHAIFKATDILPISRHPNWDSQHCWHMFSLDLLNQYLVPYTHTVDEGIMSIPQVPTVNFRFPIAPVNSESGVFQILLNNSSELTGYWEIYTAPPPNWKKYLDRKSLSKKVIFSDGRVKDNPDLLATLWATKFVHEVDASPGDIGAGDTFTFDDEKQKCRTNAKRDTELFKVSPINGSLKGKASQIITLEYKFKSVGYNQMSLLFRVYPAVFVWIDLSGQTLDIEEPFLQLMDKNVMRFQQTSLSDLDPPLQMLWMYNGGNVSAEFYVDMEPFDELKKSNFNHAVIDCLTIRDSVPPKSWFPIKLRFAPLEYTEYSIPLIIVPEFAQNPMQVMLKGSTAFVPLFRFHNPIANSSIRAFSLYDQSVPITITPDHIVFPHCIPTGHKSVSIVFVMNTHVHNFMIFRWTAVSIAGGGSITFQPECGRIGPNEKMSCQIILQAGNTSATFSIMARCIIEDENENEMYTLAMDHWKKEKLQAELMDTLKPKKTQNRFPNVSEDTTKQPVTPRTYSRLLSISAYIGTVFGLFDTITPREKSKMSHAEPISSNRPIPLNTDFHSGIILSQFEREMSEELISNLLLDIFSSQSFESMVRSMTKRQAPLYNDYKEWDTTSCQYDQTQDEQNQPDLSPQCLGEIFSSSILNLMTEINANFMHSENNENWHELGSIQPMALLSAENQKNI